MTRNFAAALLWTYGWVGFLIVVVIAVTIRVVKAHQILFTEGLGILTVTLAAICLAFAAIRLRPLARRRRIVAHVSGIDLRHLRQGRLALISAMAVLVLIGCGQFAAAVTKQNVNMIYDAAFTWVIVIAIYVSVYRNLTRNVAVAIGSIAVWLVIGICFIAFNISTGANALAAADGLVAVCLIAVLARLWPDIRGRKLARSVAVRMQ